MEVPGEGQLSTATDVRETAQGTIDDTTSNGIDFGEIRDGIIDWGFGGESDVQKLEITVESMGHEGRCVDVAVTAENQMVWVSYRGRDCQW